MTKTQHLVEEASWYGPEVGDIFVLTCDLDGNIGSPYDNGSSGDIFQVTDNRFRTQLSLFNLTTNRNVIVNKRNWTL